MTATRTRADLIGELDSKAEALDEMTTALVQMAKEVNKLRADTTHVPEADALAACIRALDDLIASENTAARDSGSYSLTASGGYFDQNYRTPATTTARILKALAAKYRVDLVEVTTEPCARAHVDQIDPTVVQRALQQAGGPN